MPQQKPWEKYAAPNGMPAGSVQIAPAAPDAQYKGPMAEAELAAKRQEAKLRQIAIDKAARDLANTPDADLSPDVLASISAGKPVKLQDLPPSAQGIVSGLLQGNLPAGQRSIASKSMLPYIKMAMSVDPQFSANTFAARQKATQQLADMKSTGGYLTSLTANIDHSREEEAAIRRLGNPGGLYGRWGGAALHNWLYNKGGPAEAQFNQANRVYSGEQVKSITGNVGNAGGQSALADRQDAERAIGQAMPGDAQWAALRTGAIQNYQKYRDANAGYRRTMGTDMPAAMSPEQAQQLLHLMRIQEDGTEGPIPPGIDPGFIALATGTAPDGGNGGGGNAGGAPGAGPSGGPTSGPGPFSPVSVSGDGSQTVVGTGTNSVANPEGQAILAQEQSLLANKAPDERIRAWAANVYGTVPSHIEQMLAARRAGTPINLVPQEGLLTKNVRADSGMFGTLADAMATSPLAVGVGEAGNAAGAGIPQWLAGKASGNADLTRLRFDTAANQNAPAATIGQLVGGAAGAFGGEALAAKTLSKLPYLAKILGGGEMAAARGGDALYGGLSGAASNPDDPYAAIKGAAFGAGGGMVGRRVTSAIGSGLRGVTNESVRYLKGAGVPLTLGQAVSQSGWLGKAVKGAEDGLLSVPIAGDMAGYTRNRGIAAFNRAGFKEGLSGITNDVPPAIGEQGVEMGLGKVTGAYDDALNGKTITLPSGPMTAFGASRDAGFADPSYGSDVRGIHDRNITPLMDPSGNMTGSNFQKMDRSLDGYARKYGQMADGTPMVPAQPGAEAPRDAFRGMGDALDSAVSWSAPEVLPQYQAAKGAFRNTMVLKDAVNRARNGTRSGDAGVFMPSQLADAAAANSRVFGGTQGTTNQPFFDLTRAGQAVLPSKLADSGTAKRLGILAATGGLLGGGQLSGNETAGNASTDAGITLGALAAAMSPVGQRALRAAVLKRPEWMRLAGNTVQNAAPYGGMIGAPIALQLQGR